MSEKYAALKQAAEKATPGPWYVHNKPCEDGNYGIDTSDKEFLAEAVVWWGFARQGIWREEDAKHIAAANPATILELLAERDADKARIAELEARTLTVKLPDGYAVRSGHPINEGERGVMIPKEGGDWLHRFDVEHALQVAGVSLKEKG
ncbi:ead/Ea22-like family protein [Pseudescherichia sp.]|uniref:ead/Ea22-like family protein n=1 Tax=Pseudescherichia sp. TaxID=2055881 RepID=UPI0028B18646|nr:ead/Ea22-like family protein [Pseudescherichia sp.]